MLTLVETTATIERYHLTVMDADVPNLLIRSSQALVLVLFSLASFGVVAAGEAPTMPENLAGAISGNTVSLSWDDSTDTDDAVEGYNVYRNNAYVSTVFDSAYSGQVEPNTLYSFYVVAFDEAPRTFSPASDSVALPESLVPTDLTIPPTVPAELSGVIDGTDVTLQWSASTDDEAVLGYNVYRNNQYLTTVSQPEYSGSVVEGATTSFYIVAFDIRRNFSQRSSSITLPDRGPVDTTISPEPPDALVGNVEEGGPSDTVTVNWNEAVDDQAVAGYNIYRNGQYIATRFVTEFVGRVPAGSSNAFSVVAFDFDGNFSAASASLILPEGPGSVDPELPPSIPAGLAGSIETANGQTTVVLTWEPSTSVANVAGYNIYRNNDYLTTVRTTTFTDTVAAGQAFSYTIVSFDDFGNFSARSDRLSLLGNANQPPFFSDLADQSLRVGELFELRLSPVDLDGGAAGILTSALPTGMENVDNRDGTRALRWTPAPSDVGSYDITLTAFDLADTDLRTSETITLMVSDDGTTPTQSLFEISVTQAAYNLREGDVIGVEIPVSLTRDVDYDGTVELSVIGESDSDTSLMRMTFSDGELISSETQSLLMLGLDIDVLPIRPQQRRFTIVASDGNATDSVSVTVAVTPVERDDIYLLIGQSNMAGFSEVGAKQAGTGQPDATNLRIRQLNVAANERSRFVNPADFSSASVNVVAPRIVPAEDPLHVPVDPDSLAKEGDTIGLGLSFAKQALNATTRNIVLVPAAWAGTGFCGDTLLDAQWNPNTPASPALGNTLLFDRALSRINSAITETGGILRGILWLQGEADGSAECAPLYEQNLVGMVEALRSRIDVDARGSGARGPDASIPFLAGTLTRGVDSRGDFSNPDANELIVDGVHRSISSLLPFAEVSLHDDLVPANGFSCGVGSCIHFGSDALREMGVRYYDALLRAYGGRS